MSTAKGRRQHARRSTDAQPKLVKVRGFDANENVIWEATAKHVSEHAAHVTGRLAVLKLVAELSGNAVNGRLPHADAMDAIYKAVTAELSKVKP